MNGKKEKRKNMKNNLEYFWMYYKLPLAAGLVVVFLILYFAVTSWTAKENMLSVMLIDCHTEISGEEMADAYMEAAEIDQKKYQVQIQNNLMFQGTDSGNYAMTSLSRFMADIGSELLDVCGMTLEDFEKYDKSGTWMDLRECLTEQQCSMLEKFFLESDDGRAIGLRADMLWKLDEEGCYEGSDAAIGILYNTPHIEEAVRYLLYLAGEMA